MVEPDAPVSGRVEQSTAQQRLPLLLAPVLEDGSRFQNPFGSVDVERLVRRPNGACAGQGKSEREALRPEVSLSVCENTAVGAVGIVFQLGGDIRIVLLRPRAETPGDGPGRDQLREVQ